MILYPATILSAYLIPSKDTAMLMVAVLLLLLRKMQAPSDDEAYDAPHARPIAGLMQGDEAATAAAAMDDGIGT